MADDETTTTKKRPAGEGEGTKRPARKPESSESKRPAPKRSAGDRPSSGGQSSSGSESASRSTESQEGSTAKRPASTGGEESGKSDGGGSGRRMTTAKAARGALDQLQDLTNRDAEGIVGVEKNDEGGWTVTIEVVESRRIPNTADVLAEYSVTVDAEGDLTSYSRLSRYVRGRATRGE